MCNGIAFHVSLRESSQSVDKVCAEVTSESKYGSVCTPNSELSSNGGRIKIIDGEQCLQSGGAM